MNSACLRRWLALFWLAMLTAARSEVLMQWGENPSGAGTPGTNIVQGNQVFTGSGSTYTGATNSPVVGVNYYPDAAGRSPRFSVAVSSITNGGARLVEGATSGDRLAIYAAAIPTGGTFRGMVMWASNQFVIADRPITLTNATVVANQRLNPDTTNQALHIVVRQSNSYFISEAASFGATATTQSFALAGMTWRTFTPFVSGTETIGSVTPAPSLLNVQAVGFYFSAQNAATTASTCGANTTFISVEGQEEAGGATYTLSVQPNTPAWGGVTPTGGTYNAGQSVELTATASNHFQFAGWSGDLGGVTNPVTIAMNADRVIVATFTEILATNQTPHWWLAENGLSPDDAGALSDDDLDGHQAWQEYIAGTRPDLATSVLHVASLRLTGGAAVLSWPTVTDRVYQVNWSTNISGAFTPFPDATSLTWSVNSYTDLVHSAEPLLHFSVGVRRAP